MYKFVVSISLFIMLLTPVLIGADVEAERLMKETDKIKAAIRRQELGE